MQMVAFQVLVRTGLTVFASLAGRLSQQWGLLFKKKFVLKRESPFL